MEKTKIIIDTDIGDDIDDALAIAFALNCPELDILAMTTCFNNAESKAKILVKLLELAGRQDIPVRYGLSRPMMNPKGYDAPPRQYYDELNDIKVKGDGVQFLAKTLLESKEKVTLVPIGPLTNIAALLITYPKTIEKIEKIVLMGGCYYQNQIEWNIVCDAEAAKIVFESGVKIVGVGLDVTMKCNLDYKNIEKIRGDKREFFKYISKLMDLWNQGRDYKNIKMFLHDPLAVAAVFKPELLEIYPEKIFIETTGTYTNGMTYNKSLHQRAWGRENDISSNVYVCKDVDSNVFLDLFMGRILR